MQGTTGNSRKEPAGFSMVELIIVVAVIGILASIAIPLLLDQKDKATIGVTQANLDAMRAGLNQYVVRSPDNTFPAGVLNYFQFRSTVPETNLPALEVDAKILSSSFLYSSDGTTYFMQATSTSRSAVRFTASPTGIQIN